jgi:hypothetical protein
MSKHSIIKLRVGWKRNTEGNLCLTIQNVPVAVLSSFGNWGYRVRFIDKIIPTSKAKSYFQKEKTAMRHAEKRFGIYSDRLRNLFKGE